MNSKQCSQTFIAESSSLCGLTGVFSVLWIKSSGKISDLIPRCVLVIERTPEKIFLPKRVNSEGSYPVTVIK